MKAVLIKKYGGSDELITQTHSLPDPNPDQVLIQVKYAGVNFPDTLIIRGKYQYQPQLPFSPGGEVAGIIKKAGTKVSSFRPGDRVVCGTGWGGFAEEALGLSANTHHLPKNVSFEDAAAMLMTYGTVIHALKDRASLQKGDSLAVLGGAGGVGTAAIQLGKWMGSRVIACVSTKEKSEYCKIQGADEVLVYQTENLKNELKMLTKNAGVDVVFDPIGGQYTEQAFRAIAPNGRHLVVGFASGHIPKIPLNLPLLKSASLIGVFWGYFYRNFPQQNQANIQLLLGLLEKGDIKPQVEKIYPMSQATNALQHLEHRKAHGKVLLKI